MNTRKQITFEKHVMATMISIYCRKSHCKSKNLCEDCFKLYRYCKQRLDKCPFGENKPACQNCKIHCYEKRMQERVRKVMAFSGPRMLYQHPIMSLKHLYQSKFTKPLNLKEFRQKS